MKARCAFLTLCLAWSHLNLQGAVNLALDNRMNDATDVIRQILMTPDKAISNSIARRATCVGVIPSVKKAAFFAGGSYGQGVVTCRTPRAGVHLSSSGSPEGVWATDRRPGY